MAKRKRKRESLTRSKRSVRKSRSELRDIGEQQIRNEINSLSNRVAAIERLTGKLQKVINLFN